MGSWLSEREQRLVAGAEAASAATPVPTQIVSNGEYLPPSQSATALASCGDIGSHFADAAKIPFRIGAAA